MLDQITGAWLPDTNLVYGLKLAEYGLYDTRLIAHDMRFMITNNKIDPNIYRVTKVVDMSPQGLIKLTVKQDELDLKRDNVDLLICDYYDNSGEVQVDIPSDTPIDPMKTSVIRQAIVDSDGELEISDTYNPLEIGKMSYYVVEFSDADIPAQWSISLIDEDGTYSPSEIKSLEKLMVITNLDETTISLRPGKSNKLKGLRFKLSVSNQSGDYLSDIEVEVGT